jgi:hypothetical protein
MRRAALLVALGALVLCAAAPGRAQTTPRVTVVDSPLAERWLARAGVTYARRTGASLETAPIRGARLLILPVESVTTASAAEHVREFLASGGKVVAVYWGTLGPETSPSAQLAATFGIRPVGWSDDPPRPLAVLDAGIGAAPFGGERLMLPIGPAAVVEALPGTEVVARWIGPDAAEMPEARTGAAFLRGGALYLTPDLLRPGNDRPECRELLFWAIQRVAPDFGPVLQARDRLVTAGAACGAAATLLSADAPADWRAELEAAQNELADARRLLAQGRAVRATAAADRCRALAEELIERIRAGRGIQP